MKKSVRITLTQDEYNHLIALKKYLGCKSLVETVSFAVEKEINRHHWNNQRRKQFRSHLLSL